MTMLQNFTAPPAGVAADRIPGLREQLDKQSMDGFFIPKHEASPPHEERLAWLLGFTGSLGLAIVLRNHAALFVDGRYVLQAREQVTDSRIEQRSLTRKGISAWLEETLGAGERLGYDPWSHSIGDIAWLTDVCERTGAKLVPCESNPVDALWRERPPAPRGKVRGHAMEHAGESSGDKTTRIAEKLRQLRMDAVVVDRGDSIAWLLNVRSWDAPHTPLVLSKAILFADGRTDWFVAGERLEPGLENALSSHVRVCPAAEFMPALDALQGKRVLVDNAFSADAIRLRLEEAGARLSFGQDPCQLPKACKNRVEQDGARAAHVRDGVALCRFLCWLEETAANGGTDEITAVKRLEALRRETGCLQDVSFDTIAGAGPHGAIMHYRVNEASNRRLEPGELFLVDSGGQYLDGTTDVTRTVAVGRPGETCRRHYTLVLKGHVALAQARFPEGTTGAQLDILARAPLWTAGLDYDHGTGHGVGSFLDVHEGPQRISKAGGDVALEEGMIVSNEPGYYREGEYGIRIESLVLVNAAQSIAGGDRKMLGFETLTLAPFDLALIDAELLDAGERAFVNGYHRRVREVVAPRLEGAERAWLETATREL